VSDWVEQGEGIINFMADFEIRRVYQEFGEKGSKSKFLLSF